MKKTQKMSFQPNRYMLDILNINSSMINCSSPTPENTIDEFGLDEENDDNAKNSVQNQPIDETLFDCPNALVSTDDEDISNTTNRISME